MDIQAIVAELKRERSRLTRAIAALEGTDMRKTATKGTPAPESQPPTGKKRGGLTEKGRKRLSEMMKKRWAETKKKQASASRAGKE